jgi:signal transduction histidine kinase
MAALVLRTGLLLLLHRRTVLIRVAAAAALLALAGVPQFAQAVEIDGVEWTQTPVGTPPARDASWLRFELPHRWTAPEGSPLQGVALRLKFSIDERPSEAWAVLIGQATNGGRVSINGRFIGAVQRPDERAQVRWRRPHLLAIDPGLLNPGENTLLVQTAYRGGTHVFGDVAVGKLSEMSARYERLYFMSTTIVWIGATLAAVLALLFGVLWLRRPEALLGLITLAAGVWVVRSAYFLIEAVPVATSLGVELLYYLSTAGFALVIMLALLRMIGRREPREEKIAFGFAALGPLLVLVTAQHAGPYLDKFWAPVLLVLVGTALVHAIVHRIKHRDTPSSILLVACGLALLAAAHDYLQWLGWTGGMHALLLHWAGPLTLMALATPLVDRFVRILRDAEAARADLETRVREREQLLKRNYERLRESERLQAIGAERARIMQDMHDGLGSQLLSSLMLVERGAVSHEQVAQILRESIDDMRLAIDAIAVEDAGLLSALGNLRFRMEPRLRAAGIELLWDARGLPEEVDINPDAVLPILRIVQEAMTNALKHSRARQLQVMIVIERGGEQEWLNIKVTDNGRGITEERAGGRGLVNMRNRAAKIGALLKLDSIAGAGTMVQLRYRIEVHTGEPTTRISQLPLNTEAVIERARAQ